MTRRRPRFLQCLLSATAVVALGATLSACGGSGSTPTTTSTTIGPTTTTTTPAGASERALYAKWCTLKVLGPKSSAVAVLGPAIRHGKGPVRIFQQQLPSGFSYQIWSTTDYVLFAVYSGQKIFGLTALPVNLPPVALGCAAKRGGTL